MPMQPPTFRPRGYQSTADRNRDYDARRGTARKRGYSATWHKASVAHRKVHPICLGCEAMGLTRPAGLVDHIEPHRGDQAKFWDPANWQSCCEWHHSVVKQRLELMFERGELAVEALRLDGLVAIALARELGGPP